MVYVYGEEKYFSLFDMTRPDKRTWLYINPKVNEFSLGGLYFCNLEIGR